MSLLFVCSAILLLLDFSGATFTIYVRPNEVESCPGEVCDDIDHFATTLVYNSTVVFMPGNHTLTSVLIVSNSSYLNFTVMDSTEPTVVTCKQSTGLVFKSIRYLRLKGLSFQYCGFEYRSGDSSALRFENIANLYLEDVHVRNSSGYGIVMKNIFGSSTITESTFTFNHGFDTCGGNVLLEYSECLTFPYSAFLEISHSSSSFGSFDQCMDNVTVATGLTLILSCSEVQVLLFNVSLYNNSNSLNTGFGGNLFIHFLNKTSFTSNQVIVQECILSGGSSGVGGGIAVTMYTEQKHAGDPGTCNNTLSIIDSIIYANSAVTGAGIFIEIVTLTSNSPCPKTHIFIQSTIFDSNVVVPNSDAIHDNHGVAIHILNGYTRDFLYGVAALKIYIYNSTIQGSQLKKSWQRNTNVAALCAMKFLGDLILSNTTIMDNNVSAISLIKSKVTFTNQNTLANNTAINGGGLKMCESSYIILWYNTTLFFTANHAMQYGGAVYVEEPCSSHPTCFYQFPFDAICDEISLVDLAQCYNSRVIMTGNSASRGGDDIFGGSVDTCNFHKTHH